MHNRINRTNRGPVILVQVIPAGSGLLTMITLDTDAFPGFKVCAVGEWFFGLEKEALTTFVIGCQDLVPLPPFPPMPSPPLEPPLSAPQPLPRPSPTPSPQMLPMPIPVTLPMPDLSTPAPMPAPALPGTADVILASETVLADGGFRIFMTNMVPVLGIVSSPTLKLFKLYF